MKIQEKYHNEDELDIIGDIHGCFYELVALVKKLGYRKSKDGFYRHPEGRKLAFVGDITDRGPENEKCLEFVYNHTKEGLAFSVTGNHDDKLYRTLKGNPTQVSNGLQKTLDELKNIPDSKKDEYWKWLKDLPLSLSFDEGNLIVCHAAPPHPKWGKGKSKSVCLYGHTTGKTTEKGYPERGLWGKSWDGCDIDAMVVCGHVTHRQVNRTDQTICIDTSCYVGYELTAYRWPEDEVVSVPSEQPVREDYVFAEDTNRSALDPYDGDARMKDIEEMYIPTLLEAFDNPQQEENLLKMIDQDADLKKKSCNGLTIANAGPSLYMPEKEHHLYAKGIVYETNPYRLVSLPLLKMYNHSRHEVSDKLSGKLEDDSDVTFEWMEKADGAMIQLFAHEGEVYFTTRSVLEGSMDPEDLSFNYVAEARELAEETNPKLTDPEFIGNKTLVFELIHPGGQEGVTFYEEEKLELLSVYDQDSNRYWTNEEVLTFGGRHKIPTVDILLREEEVALEEGVDRLLEELENDPQVPEGAVLCFESDDEIVHRVKIKTQTWLRRFKLKSNCSFGSTVDILWDSPELWDWDSFLDFLRENDLTEEEIEDYYKEHFEDFLEWKEDVEQKHQEVKGLAEDYYKENGTPPEKADPEFGEYTKHYALHFQNRDDVSKQDFGLLMGEHRNDDGIELADVMKAHPAYDGHKGTIIHTLNNQ